MRNEVPALLPEVAEEVPVRKVQVDLEKQGHKLDRWQFMSLVQAARRAKEALWADEEKAELPVALAGRGSSLFASALSVPLSRAVLDRVVVEGFLPRTGIDEAPQELVFA